MRIQLKNKTKQNKIKSNRAGLLSGHLKPGVGSGGLSGRGGLLLLSLSVELEGNATVSNRKLEETWQTVVDCSLTLVPQNSPLALVLLYVR